MYRTKHAFSFFSLFFKIIIPSKDYISGEVTFSLLLYCQPFVCYQVKGICANKKLHFVLCCHNCIFVHSHFNILFVLIFSLSGVLEVNFRLIFFFFWGGRGRRREGAEGHIYLPQGNLNWGKNVGCCFFMLGCALPPATPF